MTLPSWTVNPFTPLSIEEIEGEFSGESPKSLSEYYATPGGYVTPDRMGYPFGIETPIPSPGNPISISNFYGASAVPYAIFTDKNNYNEGETVYFTITAPEPDGNVLYWTIEDVTVSVELSPGTLPNGSQNVPGYQVSIVASGGIAPYVYSVVHGTLPAGLSLDQSSGIISGRPTGLGTSSFIVEGLDTEFNSGVKVYSITIDPVNVTLGPITAELFRNVPVSFIVGATGGTAPYVFTLESGNLPTGLSLINDGTISGTPSANGNFTFTLRATDVNTNTSTRQYVLSVGTVSITLSPVTLSSATRNINYSATVVASGGTSPYTYAVTAGTLPSGIALDSATGEIAGKSSSVGTSNFTITATDANTNTGTRNYALEVIDVNITLSSLTTTLSQNVPVTLNATASGGSSPYIFSLDSGTLPTGLSLATDGTISGTPTQAQAFTFTLKATDVNTNFGTRQYTITVGVVTITIQPATLPAGETNIDYSESLIATGGASPYVFTLDSGTLPGTFALSTSGELSGKSPTAGTTAITVRATDVNGNFGTKSYNLLINQVVITLSPVTLPAAQRNIDYTETLSASGGTGPYVFSVKGGTSMGVFSISSSGVITGKSSTLGNTTFTILATDVNGNVGERQYTITVEAVTITVLPTTLPDPEINTPYSETFTASGGTSPYSFSVTTGATSIPTGLSVASSGSFTGTPTVLGTKTFTIKAVDANANEGTRQYTLEVVAVQIIISPTTLQNATINDSYTETFTATGGSGTYTWTRTAGSFPTGMSLATNGNFTGTPTVTGTFNFTIRATDSNTNFATQAYTLTVDAVTIFLDPTTLPDAIEDQSYTQAITASGGTGPYTFTIVSGALPTGMTLSNSGTLTGTVANPTVATFTVRATDSRTNTGDQAYTLTVLSNTWTITLSAWSMGTPLPSAPPITVDENNTITFTVTAPGTVPEDSSCEVRMTAPQTTNSSDVDSTIQYVNLTGRTGSATFEIVGDATTEGSEYTTIALYYNNSLVATYGRVNINDTSQTPAPTITISPDTLATGIRGASYSELFSASGGTFPYIWSRASGSFPTGINLSSSTGELSGTPTVTGTFNFTIRATDGGGFTAEKAYTLEIFAATITLSPTSLPSTGAGQSYNQTITASGGYGSYTYTVTSGTLVTGHSLASNGTISGTTASGAASKTFTITATDSYNNTGSRSYTVSVTAITFTGILDAKATKGFSYDDTVSASGGAAPYTWALTGSPPGGVSITAKDTDTGRVQGSISADNGLYIFATEATDANGVKGSKNHEVLVFGLANPGFSGTYNVPASADFAKLYLFSDGTLELFYDTNGVTTVLKSGTCFTGTPYGSEATPSYVRVDCTQTNPSTGALVTGSGELAYLPGGTGSTAGFTLRVYWFYSLKPSTERYTNTFSVSVGG